MPLLIEVTWGKNKISLELDDVATVAQLHAALHEKTRVAPAMQKGLGKFGDKDKSKKLVDLGAKSAPAVNKVSMIGTALETVQAAVTQMNSESQKSAGRTKIQVFKDAFWLTPTFSAVLAGPYVDGRGEPCEGGGLSAALTCVDYLLSRVNPLGINPELVQRLMGLGEVQRHELMSLSTEEMVLLSQAHAAVRKCFELVRLAENAHEPPEILKVIEEVVSRVKSVEVNQWAMLPAGWKGLKSSGTVILLVTRQSRDLFSLVVCNSGEGLEYHPSQADGSKIKYKTCMAFHGIPAERMYSDSWWMLSLTLWMRTPKDVSEYNRVEVFYDVLLPWLMEGNAEPMSHQMVRESRSASLWRTPQRSNVSGTRSVLDAICHILSAGRVSLPAIKCFKTAIRFEAYRKSVEDLVLAARRFDPPRDTPMHKHIQELIVQGIDPKSLNLSFNDIFDAVVADDKDGVGVKGEMGQPLHREYFQGKITAVYVGASWCAPCQKVAPRIVEAFQSIYEKSRRGQGPPASVIYFGADRDEKSYFEYIKKLTGFCRAVWPCRQAMEELQVYTQSIPTLIIFDENGLLVTTQGVKAVLRDPEAKDFPNGLWRGASPLGDTDVALFGISCRQLVYDARKKCAAGILKESYLDKVIQLVTSASLLVETFPKSGEFALTTVESMALDCRTPSSKFTIWDLLRRGSIDEYIGREYSSSEGVVCDLSVFKRSANMHELHTVLTAAVQRVSVLWGRAKTSGASSRVALQLEIVEFISWLMVEIVPIPNLNSPETCIYVQPFHSDSDQFQMLDAIHSLLLSFATAWQAVDPPTRAHDSERAIVSACSLVSFEAIARSQAPNSSQQCQVLAFLMNHERGLRFSSSSCQSNRSFEEISRSFELRRPQYLFAREQLLRYFRTSKERFRDEIFDIHQAHKLELRMHSNTIHFVTNYIQQCGYELIPRRQQMRTPEMEVIMTWLLDPNSKLNSERREFSLTRNVVLMCKFLFTMDQRDAQLWRKKKERDRLATWRLSFEEEGPGQHLSASWRTSPSEPRWEYLGLRGADQDIADFEVKGFGDRQIDYGEGLVVQSPTNLSAMLGGCLHPMEDDVLHFENLPSFGGILSSDESEVLLSCLSVEHLRIPLILDFFSSQDRYMHLFSVKLQNLLRAVLLEPGSFLPRSDFRDAEHIPLRMNAHQKEVLRRQQHSSATAPRDDSLLLGTEYGLLFNELMFSHEAVFRPLSFFVKTIQEFGDCSVYSLSTSYILFMVGIVVDVLNVSMFVMAGNLPQGKIEEIRSEHKNLGLQLRSSVKSLFQSWLSEATQNDDIPTSCVLHSYKALLFLSILPDERTKNDFRDMMASSAFVRSRHGFAMGMMRSQLSAQEGEVSLTPEQRLLRFLQAQGLDSSQVSQEQLKRGSELSLSGGKRRAIFVHIRGMYGTDSVRVPNLERVDASCAEDAKKFKLPPADVPESAIMAMMQDCFKDVVTFLAACSPEDLNHIMQAIVSVVLLGQEGSVNIWIPKTGEYGVYFCRNTEMIFRANFCELLWRNEGLKSVPDTMASYDDYKYILGNDVNQCGRVRRSKNMHWVHVVGTQYDLVEWTPPDPMNQGLNCPQTISAPPCEICGLKGQCWPCKTPSCRGAIVCSSSRCGVCRAPKSQSESAEAISQAWFQGVEYCREINVYDEIAWPVIEERWAVDMIRSVFKLHFPQEGECVMKPLLQKDPHGSHVTEITVICNDAIQFKDDSQKSTWKEIIVTKEPLRLQVFNLVSHARRMFRSLVYTSNQKFSLHSLSSVDRKLEREIFFKFKDEAGSFKKRVANESTLEIRRKNQKLFGDESYVPSRLLQGVVPSVLLENFDFWMGTDEVLRGSSSGSLHWFDYSIEAEIHSNPELGGATITRRSDKQFSRISADPKQAALLRRGTVTPRTQHCIDDLAAYFPELSVEALQIALSVCDMNVASATEWLKVPENFARVSVSATSPGAVRTMSSGSPGSPKFASPTSPKAATFGSTISEDDRDILTLLNLTKWEADGSIKELSLMLSRVEDVSHILVWGIWNAESCNYDIVSVELPRLRARFQPDVGADGIKRLYFLDHPGWFVCCDSSETSLNHLTSLFDCHLLLQNESLEIALLVPNHEIRWAKIFDEPFCTTLLYDRASLLWQESVPTPFYFYVVHTCKQFLVPPSLAASLYLVASLMFKQKFAAAMRLMESCYIDTSASPEEQFMLSIIEKTESDRSPDAHACRLKLVHSIMYSDLPLPKFMSTDLHKYLDKYRQVSEQCRLSSTETIDLLKRCDRPSRLVKAQLMFCKASVDMVDSIELQCDALQWPGQPWRKLCNITAQSMENEASKLARIQYKSEDYSTPLSNELLIQFIWDDTLLCDTESGTTRQTGFMFLYFLLTKRIHAKLFDRDIDLPLGQLLSRWFHLKLARWGKEVVGENEREITPSFQMAVCMGLQYDPTLPWPQIDDEETISQLAHGADVRPRYDHQPQRRARPNRLPDFFSNLTSCLRRAISGPLTPMAARMREIMASIPREFYYNTITNLSPRLFGRLLPSNYQCSEYDLADCQSLLSPEHFACLLNMPLGQIQLDEYIQTSEVTSTKSDQLPFDVSRHPSTSSLVARDIISRLKQDMTIFCAQNKSLRHSFFAALPASSVEHIVKGSPDSDACIERCLSMLKDLKIKLQAMRESDNELILKLSHICVSEANAHSGNLSDPAIRDHVLQTIQGSRNKLTFDWICGAALSSSFSEDVLSRNPFARNLSHCRAAAMCTMLVSNRVHFAGQALLQCNTLARMIQEPSLTRQDHDSQVAFRQMLLHTRQLLSETLICKRQYVQQIDNKNLIDPRFLVFEFLFNIVLRKRQVEMVRWFVQNARDGISRVQQMIMGQGKTTVVGPLLALILADGATLVTQVMPTALLDQSRTILRKCFSVLIPKRIYTLKFDRNIEDSSRPVMLLAQKLESARSEGAIICAAPESIKALFLKFVEQLHSIEAMPPVEEEHHQRLQEQSSRLQERAENRALMADAIVPIFDLWKSGVLIMDEVDVLLHSLRSELNFPIGEKKPIDLSGPRWFLPLHIFDGLFFRMENRVTSSFLQTNPEATAILEAIVASLQRGLACRALQREPHIVLLVPHFYFEDLGPAMLPWVLLWLRSHLPIDFSEALVKQYLIEPNVLVFKEAIEREFTATAIELLNLSRNWMTSILPHVLSKINRVGFGLLQAADLTADADKMPLSRKLSAVPFIAKDVPSRSSEFAHPDVVIGTTILAFRYEGLRLTDVRDVLVQMKQDFSLQTGPAEKRPASKQFRHWLSLVPNHGKAVSHLSQLQVADKSQIKEIYHVLSRVPEVIYHYLCCHVFPKIMAFQEIKASACGHELGSSMLFGRRIGFSGTPSNLLPIDLGECFYEPGSDGNIVTVLSDPNVTTAEVLSDDWGPRMLLRKIATSEPSFHALIDTGALITNLENEEVAGELMKYLPPQFEGVTFLDRSDRQMVLLRGSGRVVPSSQCGIPMFNRFTFFDQIHTTGIDIKQSPTARAVITIGKDMVFRDYAQGAYRMRGIGKGQTIHLYLVPEVIGLVSQTLQSCSAETGKAELDVPAWLLLNSIHSEGMQYIKLCTQEIGNIYRKAAFHALVSDVKSSGGHASDGRLNRFSNALLRQAIIEFREPIGFPVPSIVPVPRLVAETLKEAASSKTIKPLTQEDEARVVEVLQRVRSSAGAMQDTGDAGVASEVIHEQEAEAEEEAEEEAEQEEQKVSQFSRDDEDQLPFNRVALAQDPMTLQDASFYNFSKLRLSKDQGELTLPENLFLSDNFFKIRWHGLGNRRLKTCIVILQWIYPGHAVPVFACITLAEAETIRWMMQNSPSFDSFCVSLHALSGEMLAQTSAHAAIAAVSLQRSAVAGGQAAIQGPNPVVHIQDAKSAAIWFRFFNCELFFSDEDLEKLESILRGVAHLVFMHVKDRVTLFESSLRLRFFNQQAINRHLNSLVVHGTISHLHRRRRQRHQWIDTPLIRILSPSADLEHTRAVAKVNKVSQAIIAYGLAQGCRLGEDFLSLNKAPPEDPAIEMHEFSSLLASYKLKGITKADLSVVTAFFRNARSGLVHLAAVKQEFQLEIKPIPLLSKMSQSKDATMWTCSVCTYAFNPRSKLRCDVCNVGENPNPSAGGVAAGFGGMNKCPPGKWACQMCTVHNLDTLFYCDACEHARPDLASMRF